MLNITFGAVQIIRWSHLAIWLTAVIISLMNTSAGFASGMRFDQAFPVIADARALAQPCVDFDTSCGTAHYDEGTLEEDNEVLSNIATGAGFETTLEDSRDCCLVVNRLTSHRLSSRRFAGSTSGLAPPA